MNLKTWINLNKMRFYSNFKRTYKYGEFRENLEKQFKVKLNEIRKKKFVNVIFYVQERAKWSSNSLLEALKREKNFSVKIVLQKDNIDELNFFKSLGVEVISVYSEQNAPLDILTLNPDLVIYQQPWAISEINSIERLSQHVLTAYIPYGYMAIKSDYAHYFMPFHWHLWKYFCENNDQKKLFEKKNKKLSNILVNKGYPKMDVYFKINNNNLRKKSVIWAPHWSFGENFVKFGTFDEKYEFFYNLAQNYKNITWVYKPHPKLESWIRETNLMSDVEYQDYLKRWDALPNTKIVMDGNYFDIFFSSDALITDSVSFLFEYLPTKKPIIYIDSKKGCGFNEITAPIVKSYYNVTTNEEIEKTLKEVVFLNNDYKYKERMKHLKNFMDNKTPAGENIVKYLKKVFDIRG